MLNDNGRKALQLNLEGGEIWEKVRKLYLWLDMLKAVSFISLLLMASKASPLLHRCRFESGH